MSNIKLFQDKKIRTTYNEKEQKWYFSVVDIIEVLTESVKPRDYWYRLKKREKVNGIELSTNCRQFKMMASDGKMRETEIADTETLLRIIQSVPSPKAEPFKKWLAKVGYERLQEIEDPELASKRAREIYQEKGYPEDWIEKRMRSIAIREELTDEWKDRGIKEHREYAILTAEISKAAFGLSPSEYKKVALLNKHTFYIFGEKTMNCTRCQSSHKVKRGILNQRQRYTCKDCGYMISCTTLFHIFHSLLME